MNHKDRKKIKHLEMQTHVYLWEQQPCTHIKALFKSSAGVNYEVLASPCVLTRYVGLVA